MQIILPISGETIMDDDGFSYPKPLIEIGKKTIIESTIDYYSQIDDVEFFFLIKEKDDKKYKFSETLRQACCNHKCTIIVTKGTTSGAVSTCLLASAQIDMSKEVIIANYDQKLNVNITEVLSFFRNENTGFGVVSFDSVHPKWSYIKVEGKKIKFAAEKKPISRHAVAGFYYFQKFEHFFNAASNQMLSTPINIMDNYVSETLNHLILDGVHGVHYQIKREDYINYYDANMIKKAQAK